MHLTLHFSTGISFSLLASSHVGVRCSVLTQEFCENSMLVDDRLFDSGIS